ncbi:MAG: DUF1952 domain-containing protein [Chloroflexi bacterium]|nr:DUF1952 domain-containing protein [Chloroflexota bacterium]
MSDEGPAAPALELTVTGIPCWLLGEYLEELGGEAQADGWYRGERWAVRLIHVEDYCLGSLRVGRVRLELHGAADAVARLHPCLEKKLLRAGG